MFSYLDQDPDGIEAMRAIRETGKLEEDTEKKLEDALKAFTDRFVKA